MTSSDDEKWRISYDHLDVDMMRYILRSANRDLPKGRWGHKRDYLCNKIINIDRGVLEYKRFRVGELRTFLLARGLNIPRPNTKAMIKHALEEADADPEFHYFLKLPPEVRLMVYGHASNSIADIRGTRLLLPIPVQPAITRVCRLVREESLPLFYSSTEFAVDFSMFNGHVPKKANRYPSSFLRSLNNTNFSMIKRLRLSFFRTRYLMSNSVVSTLKIAGKTGTVISSTTKPDHAHAVHVGDAVSTMKHRVDDLVVNGKYKTGPRLARWCIANAHTELDQPKFSTFDFVFEVEIV